MKSDELFDKVRELAGLFLSIREIAILCDMPFEEFSSKINTPDSPLYLAYWKGKTTAKYLIRKKVIDLAIKGSPQAEALADKYIEEQELEDSGQ